ncbi:serine/threonine-protein kinase [Streptomyces sp. NPDC001930]|uniref:serine/threonine-protein kinase n=1 Tax=Streptomyces sp. NPDC001930 TaxID=3364625 RepID=UPI0036ADDA23
MRPLKGSDPREIGSYRILAELGSGGMGRVLLGAGPDGRLAAVKVVHAQFMDDPGFRARFRREVEASRKVSGAYTAAVIDADSDAPSPWLASSFVQGPSLFEVVETVGGLPEDAVLRLAAGLATSLIAIHRARLVHRDLKPSNVLLADDGPRVIDFGIARATDSPDTGRLTRTGWLVGSPGFMSPEQAQGLPVSAASDVFSLGAVLVVACTGRDPFAGSAALQIMYNVVHTEPDLCAIPQAIRPVIEACLAKTPTARPTPADLLRAIGTVDPSTRPWPEAVHRLISRQRAELTQLLGETGEPLHQSGSFVPTTLVATDKGHDRTASDADSGQESPFDRAIRIARSIDDPEQRTGALLRIAQAVPDRAAALLIGDMDRDGQEGLLVALAGLLMDKAPQRALQAIDRLLQIPLDAEPELEEIMMLAHLAARVGQASPVHAVALITHREHHLPPRAPDRAAALAALAKAAATVDPELARQLISGAEEIARTLHPDRGTASEVPRAMGIIIKAAWAADPQCATRLADLAERSALNITEDGYGKARAWALLHIATAVAEADLHRAKRLIAMMSYRPVRGKAWGYIIREAVATHRADVPDLLDAAEASVLTRAETRVHESADTGRGTLWQRLRDAFNGPGATAEGDVDVDAGAWDYWDYLADVAVAAAPFDPSHAESLARRMTEGDKRVKTLIEMAKAVSEARPALARQWFYDAHQAALGLSADPILMVSLAAAATTTAPKLAKQVAERIAGLDDTAVAGLSQSELVQLASCVAAVDPDRAVRLIDLAEARERHSSSVARLDDIVWRAIANALIVSAAAWVRSDPKRSELMLHRVQQAALSIESAALKTWIEWSPLAAALVAQAPDRAEEFVSTLTDDALRAGAVVAVAVATLKADTAAAHT